MTPTSRHHLPDSDLHRQIADLIRDLEERNDIDVLLAVEQGSRAWGLESSTSDHDIRFIYRERPERAFALFRDGETLQRQVALETDRGSVDIEMSGWTLQKALKLAASSNPQIGEMARAEMAYRRQDRFQEDLLDLSSQASPRVMAHYYRGTAKKNLLGKICPAIVSDVKTNLQMVRGMLSAIWFTQNPGRGGFPPLKFEALREAVDLTGRQMALAGLDVEIDDLISLKRSGAPRKTEKLFTMVTQWGLAEIEALDREVMTIPDTEFDVARVEQAFRNQYPDVFPDQEECSLTADI